MFESTPSILPARRDLIYLVGALVLVAAYVLLAEMRFMVGFPLDDAWIHQTYARNLAQSGEWAFVPGQPSAASTAPLYTVLLAVGHRLGLAPYFWTYFSGALTLALAASMAARIAERLFREQQPRLAHAIGFATGFSVLLAWHLIWAAASGMETMLFMALALVVIGLAIQYVDSRINIDNLSTDSRYRVDIKAGLMMGIAGGLLTLTRPEGVVLVGLAGLLMLIALGWQRAYVMWAGGVIIGWALIVSPYLLWNYDLTGQLLPSTADAKITEYAALREDFILIRYARLLLPVLIGGQLIGLPGILRGIGLTLQAARAHRAKILYLLPLIWAVAHLTLFAIRLPAAYQHGRYVMPIIPMLLLYMVGGYADLLRRWRGTPIKRIISRTLAIGTAAAFPLFAWIGGQAYANDVRLINTEMVATAQWIETHIPADELLAVHDIGAVGYFAPREIVDLAGLVTPEIVPLMHDRAAMLDYVCERGVMWLMVLPDHLHRLMEPDDPRLTLIPGMIGYESPYPYMDAAHPPSDLGRWKMRVYRLDCE